MWQLISCALACAGPTTETGYELNFDECRLQARMLVRFETGKKAACLSESGDVWTTDNGWERRVRL